jgi:hypothetical protein
MLSKKDYFLMAGVFRQIYLSRDKTIFISGSRMYQEVLHRLMKMLQEDNPRFNREYFTNFIRFGRCRVPQSRTSETQA